MVFWCREKAFWKRTWDSRRITKERAEQGGRPSGRPGQRHHCRNLVHSRFGLREGDTGVVWSMSDGGFCFSWYSARVRSEANLKEVNCCRCIDVGTGPMSVCLPQCLCRRLSQTKKTQSCPVLSHTHIAQFEAPLKGSFRPFQGKKKSFHCRT